ncbi:MAG: DUF2490 domain-containing protein [Coxiellaceae bacterium]|nr:DUF2490 domain-containing protein [Coxiellaceae bacterium]
MRKLISTVVLLMVSGLLYANSTNHNFMVWTDVNWQDFTDSGVDYTLNSSFRFIDDSPTFNQSVLRGGVGYSFTKDLAAWVGYTFVPTQNVGTNHFVYEQRSWQQLQWAALSAKNIAIVSDTRLEQRYFNQNSATAWRLRQRLTFDLVPVSDFLPVGFTPLVYDEIMFNLNHPQWVGNNTLNQNRLFIGVATRIKDRFVFQLGYLNQYIFLNPIDTDNHVFSLSLTLLQ